MNHERWFHAAGEEPGFEWLRPARALGVARDVAQALYARANRLAADAGRAESLYLRWLRAAAATGESVAPVVPGRSRRVTTGAAAPAVPGRSSRAAGEADRPSPVDAAQLGPGKWTRVLLETAGEDAGPPGRDDVERAVQGLAARPAAALRDQLAAAIDGGGVGDLLAAAEPVAAAAALRELRDLRVPGRSAPALRLVTEAAGGQVERVLGRGSSGAAMPAELAARIGPLVGPGAARVARLHTGDAAELIAAAHHARALTLGRDIYFARGEYAPGTERGDELLAHELTHVAQGQRGELIRAAAKGIDSGGPLDPAEAEAELRARLAVVQLHPADGPVPALAAPVGPPASDGDRAALIAAQQQRIALADQVAPPLADPPAPSAVVASAPVPSPPPAMTAPQAPAATGNAYVDTLQALPSKQAMALWAAAGTQATAQAVADQASFAASLPAMPVSLAGSGAPAGADGAAAGAAPAAGPGTPAAGALPPDASAAPAPAQPTADQVAQQTAAALAAVFPLKPADATVPQAQAQTQAQTDGKQAIDALPTTAPAVQTDPGIAPVNDLAGQTDPVRTLGDHQTQIASAAVGLDDARNRIITGPGPAQVQPVQLDDKLPVPAAQPAGAMPALPAVDGMAKLRAWSLPAGAQTAFDGIAKPRLDASLTQARAQMTQADTTRDADRAKAVADAQDKVKQAHLDADQQQQARIAASRVRIASYQADSLVNHRSQIRQLDQQSSDKRTTAIGTINTRITTDQAKVDSDFKDAQKQADDRKTQGEADAAKKKKDAQDKAANQSWWDQLVGAISSAIQSIADDINQVLTDIGTAVAQILDDVKTAACKVIDAARDFVCQTLDDFGTWLKSQVDTLIGSVFPGLAAALDQLIDTEVNTARTAVNTVADGLKTAVSAACDGLKAAVDAAIATFKAAVQAAATLAQAAVTGDWGEVTKMVLDGILSALGIDPAAFYALIGTAKDSLDQIVANPGAFVGHLIDAVQLGFHQFGDHFWAHLQDGLVQWLFGTFAQAGIHLPAQLDIAGIFDLVCQILGLTWPRLRTKVVGLIGEQNTERIEKVAGYLQALVTGGFAGLWDKVQQDLGNLWNMVVGGIRDWLVTNVVQAALIKLATMWNPAGAIFELIETAWNAYQWLRQNAQRIFGLVEAVVTSISNIVAGNIAGAASFVESSLAKLVPIAISLLADLIGLGGLADQIKTIIDQVQSTVDQAIDALIQRVMALFQGDDKGDGDPEDQPDTRTVEEKQADLDQAVVEAKALQDRNDLTESTLNAELEEIRVKHRLTELKVAQEEKGTFEVHGAVNPECTFQVAVDSVIAVQIFEAAAPRIERLTRKDTFDTVKGILEDTLKTVLPDQPNANLAYGEPGEYGEQTVTLWHDRGKRVIGSIWDRANLYEQVQTEGQQTLFKNRVTQEQFVLDKKGQYVQRRLVRNVSDQDIAQMRQNGTIVPTGAGAKTSAQQHVMGKKPSRYISATKKSDGQITNPQGETFNTGGKVVVDLLYISPEKILDLTTWTGQQEWGLSNPQGDGAKQALADVIRTQEVLIDGTIPAIAIEDVDG